MKGIRKEKSGIVVRKSGDKSVIVEVERLMKHPSIGKYIRRRKRFHVHDEKNTCQVGDKILIQECRPISKCKSWQLAEVIEKSQEVVAVVE